VAQHSLLVEAIGGRLPGGEGAAARLELLLHDAPEYVIGDIISPLKAAIGDAYKGVERRLLAAIRTRFALAPPSPTLARLVKRADRIAAFVEATRLAGFDVEEARRIFGNPAPMPERLAAEIAGLTECWPTARAQAAYLARFETLIGASDGSH